MTRSPQISGRQLSRVLSRLGFDLESQRGSHMKFVRLQGAVKEIIIVPDHRVLKKGTLHGILKKNEFDAERFDAIVVTICNLLKPKPAKTAKPSS